MKHISYIVLITLHLFCIRIQAQTPGTVTGVSAWYKANDGLASTTWEDKSGNDYHLTRTNSVTEGVINFNPAVSFNGANTAVFNSVGTAKANWPVGSNQATTYYYVARANTSATTVQNVMGIGISSHTAGFHTGRVATNTNIASSGAVTLTGSSATTITNPTWASRPLNIVRTGYNGAGASGRNYISVNSGAVINSGTNNSVSYPNTDIFRIGATGSNVNFWTGNIAEVIVYPSQHGAVDATKIESYLAVKYGITKTGNYTNTDGTVIWNETTNSGYLNNIAGIGLDNAQGLDQRQSQSQNGGFQPIIANGNTIGTVNTDAIAISVDKSYLIWGSDNASANFSTSFLYGNMNVRMTRLWKVQESGTIGTVKIALQKNSIFDITRDVYLIRSTDATLNGSDEFIVMNEETIGGVVYYTAMIDFTNGDFYTFGTNMPFPGGVSTGLNLWLNAEKGTNSITDNATITTWNDISTIRVNAATSNSGTQSYKTNGINYNPAIQFDGNGGLNFGNDYLYTPSSAGGVTLFSAIKPDVAPLAKTIQFIFDFGNFAPNHYGIYYGSYNLGQSIFNNRQEITHTFLDSPMMFTYDVNFGVNHLSRLNGATYLSNNITTTQITAAEINENPTPINDAGPVSIGRQSKSLSFTNNGTRAFLGKMGEMIHYSANLSDDERNRVETYLALKYALTMSTDYVASDGTVLWTADATYNHDIVGIVRDNASGLLQKQSRTVDDSVKIYVDNLAATNLANNGTITNNVSSIVLSNNQAKLQHETGNTEMPVGIIRRISREWKITNTNLSDTYSIQFQCMNLGNVTLSDLRLLVDIDGDFSDATITAASDVTFSLSSISTIIVSGINSAIIPMNSTRFITIGSISSNTPLVPELVFPGGVSTGLNLWLNPEKGTNSITDNATITTWNDMSTMRVNAAISNSGIQSYKTNGINYNPAIQFNGTGGFSFGNDYLYTPSSAGGVTLFSALKPDVAPEDKTIQFIFDFGNFALEHYGIYYGSHNLGQSILDNRQEITHTFSDNPMMFTYDVNFGVNHLSRLNGATYLSNNITTTQITAAEINENSIPGFTEGPVSIGRQSKSLFFTNQGTRAFLGKMGEMIHYSANLSDDERNRVETYLALKYGLTMPTDYVASDGTVLWTADATYNHDIVGIVRDNASGLLQRQSRTADDSVKIYVDNLATTNLANNGTITNNVSSIVLANNKAKLQHEMGNTEMPLGIARRFSREWKITNTNFADSYSIEFESMEIGNVTLSDLRLLVDTDGDFSDATMIAAPDVTFSLGSIIVSGINPAIIPMNSTRFITIASISTNTPLPIELITFDVKASASNVAINWTTASEKDNEYFTIERSKDGKTWEIVTIIPGAKNSKDVLNYSFVDEKAYLGTSFYRLKQTDIDGIVNYFDVKSVTVTNESTIKIYPNPAKDKIYIVHKQTIAHVKIINNVGELVLEGNYQQEVDLKLLTNGIYVVIIDTPNGDTLVEKIIIQK